MKSAFAAHNPATLDNMHPSELVSLVDAHSKNRQMRQARVQLCWDLLLLLQHAKPAFMLDYAVVDTKSLASLLQQVQAASGIQLALLSWGSGCHVVCNLEMTLTRLKAVVTPETHPSLHTPCMIGFDTATGATTPRFLARNQVLELLSALRCLLEALERTTHASALVTVNLEQLPGLPLMPTLNGWLLGYPVIYAVHSVEEAQRAARCLSTMDLTVFQVAAKGIQLSGVQAEKPVLQGGVKLTAFSLPTAMIDDGSLQQGISDHYGAEREADHSLSLNQLISEWFAGLRSKMQGEAWTAGVECTREDRGIQPVSL